MDMSEVNKGVIAEFRANEGRLSGPMEGAPILLLTTKGHRSGRDHTTPVGFVDSDGHLVVAAANGGSDQHPDWFLNLTSENRVTIEVPGASISSIASVVSGAERSRLLHQLEATLPGMSEHVSATDREIPVVVLSEASD